MGQLWCQLISCYRVLDGAIPNSRRPSSTKWTRLSLPLKELEKYSFLDQELAEESVVALGLLLAGAWVLALVSEKEQELAVELAQVSVPACARALTCDENLLGMNE